ncbi:hypothetical protein JKF63_05626 [Porcisia hertigi]|uniref:Uncharacterized protein n=1 Tax=Porcisia hertigi TaxID=2761500 RepID=A0A836HPG9_9TRYP|nr:hypothetical protein JKF63_05626 [Porcisia hertigi]
MSTSTCDGQRVIAVRRFRPSDDRDTDSSDSEVDKRGAASGWRGGAGAATTIRTHLMDSSQKVLLRTVADATSTSLLPQEEPPSSLDLSTPSPQSSSSPPRSVPPLDLGRPMAFAAAVTAAPKGLSGEKLNSSGGRESSTRQAGTDADNGERSVDGTAQVRLWLQNTDSPLRAASTSITALSTTEEEIQSVPAKVVASGAAAVAVAPSPSPAASGSTAFSIDAVPPRSTATDLFFKRKKVLPTAAIEAVVLTTSLTSSSPDAAASGVTLSSPASSLAAAQVPLAKTSMTPTPTDPHSTVAAADGPVYRSSLKEVPQEPHQTSVDSLAAPKGGSMPRLASLRSSPFSGDAALLTTDVQAASTISARDPLGGAANATPSRAMRTLNMSLAPAREKPLSSSTRLHTAASATAATRHSEARAAVCIASTFTTSAAVLEGGGSPALCGPCGVVYNRVSAQRLGSVPSRVLETLSRPMRRPLPTEHTASSVFAAAAARSAALAEGHLPLPPPPPPSESFLSTQAVPAAGTSQVAAPARAFSGFLPCENSPTRPHRQAPLLPGATHTSAASSHIEDDGARRQCSTSPVTSMQPSAQTRVGADQPGIRLASPPSPPPAPLPLRACRAAASADGATLSLLSSSAVVAAVQRQREAALIIYDDRVPPAKRRAKRKALSLTHQTGAEAPTDPMLTSLLRGLRVASSQEERSNDLLACRPILRVGGRAAWRENHVDCSTADHQFGGEAVDDVDSWGVVDHRGNTAYGRLANYTALYGTFDVVAERGQEPLKSPGEERSAKVSRHSINSHTVQRLFSEMQQPQRCNVGVDSHVSNTKNNESMSRLDLHCVGKCAFTSRGVSAPHDDVCIVSPSFAKVPLTAATGMPAVSLDINETVKVDLLNYPHSRRKQHQQQHLR